MSVMPRVIVFDVNETLLDLSALEPQFVRLFGDPRALREWFSTVLLYSEVVTLAGPYTPFGDLGQAALDMLGTTRGVPISADDRNQIITGMLALPAHPDVHDGLRRLRDAGLRLATLTNSAPDAVARQLATRPGQVLFPLATPPDIVGRDLREVAERIIDVELKPAKTDR